MDSILQRLGNPGLYHFIILPLLAITWWSVALGNTSMTFWGVTPNYTCDATKTLQTANLMTINVSGIEQFNRTHSSFVNQSWTLGKVGQCEVEVLKEGNNSENYPCTAWLFNKSSSEETLVSQWNLVCKDEYKITLSSTIYYWGVFVGGLIFGFVADLLGRKRTLFLCLFAQMPIAFCIGFMPNYVGFVIVRFLLGIWLQGVSTVGFVYCVEFFRQQYRGTVMVGFSLGWACGQMLTAMLAYSIPNWKYMQMASAFVCLVSFTYLWWLPESPRWLMTKHRITEIVNVFVRQASKMNKLNVEEMVSYSTRELEMWSYNQALEGKKQKEEAGPTFLDVIRARVLLMRLLISCYNWFVSTLAYYVFLLNIRNLAGNTYANMAVGALMEVIATLIIVFLINRCGRKYPMVIAWFIVGLMCFISGFLPTTIKGVDVKWLTTAFSLLAKMVVSSVMTIVFLFTAELFPTFARGSCFALGGASMRIGASLAPQVIFLKKITFAQLPTILIGSAAVLAGLFTMLLPQTLGTQMPVTIKDAVHLKPLAQNHTDEELLPSDTSDSKLNQHTQSSELQSS